MAWETDYVSLTEAKGWLRIGDTVDDTELAFAITEASRAIDQHTNRSFGQADPAVAVVYGFEGAATSTSTPILGYSLGGQNGGGPFGGLHHLEVHDISTATDLVVKVDRDDDGTFEETLTIDTDYRLYPWDATLTGWPWTHVVLNRGVSFPTGPRAVEITAKWGWSAVPDAVKGACLIQLARFFNRRSAPFGVAGSPELGNELRLLQKIDVDAANILARYQRMWVAA